MRDYINIVTKIQSTPWLITQEGLTVVLGIIEDRLNNGKLTDDELAMRLSGTGWGESDNSPATNSQHGIGILSLEGPLFGKANLMTSLSGATSLDTFKSDFMAMVNDGNISSILLNIDSPGGTSEMVKETGQLIYDAREEKPIYAIANSMAGSAAYWLMSQAQNLYSSPGGMVGSIGAYTVHQDVSTNDAQQGKRFTFISAGKYKTEGNEHEPLSEEGKAYRQEVINELYDDFISTVATGRDVDPVIVKENYGQGRMLTDSRALDAGMIDGITTFDNVLTHIANQPRPVAVSFTNIPANTHVHSFGNVAHSSSANYNHTMGITPNPITTTGVLIGGVVHVSDTNPLTPNLESKEYEHSEPGTGTPPAPRKDEDGSDDIAITNRWRRDPLPVFGDDAPTPHPGPPNSNVRGEVTGLTLSDADLAILRATLGCGEDELFKSLLAAVEGYTEMQSSLAAATEDDRLKTEFPQMWKQHQELLEKDRLSQANEYAQGIKTFAVMEGGKLQPTNRNLSALAVETVVQTHLKFANGTVTRDDFERCISTITQGGVVEYGERGSAREANVEHLGYIDTSSAEGIQNMRQQFFALVKEIQTQDNLDMKAAITEAAKRHPQLARAYQTSNPLNSPSGV